MFTKLSDHAAMLTLGRENGAMYPVLAWDDAHLALIDAGLPGHAKAIASLIKEAGFQPESLTEIIITHQDMDHIGAALDLQALAPKARIITHEEEAPYLDGRKTPVKLQGLLDNYENLKPEQKNWCESMKTGYANRIMKDIQTVKDGEVLPIAGGIEIIHTPGHTPGHMCLYLREGGVMVGGDGINIENGELTGPNPAYTQDLPLGMASLEKCRAHGMDALVSYHCGYLKMK